MLQFKRETYQTLAEDIKTLMTRHHRELALHQDSIPLNPDWEFYERLDNLGFLIPISARNEAGVLRGYAVYLMKEHPHYKTNSWAISDMFWLDPEERNIGNGRLLFETVENELKRLGVSVMHTTLKSSHPAAKYLLESMGHELVEYGLSKRL